METLTKKQILLIQLMEECDEVSQRCAKALRFGLDEVQEGQIMTNEERIRLEFNDLLAVADILNENGVDVGRVSNWVSVKRKKIEHYLQHSAKEGILVD